MSTNPWKDPPLLVEGCAVRCFDRDDEVREPGLCALTEQTLVHRNGHVECRRVWMLERKRVEQAEEPVGDNDRVDLVSQELPGSARRVGPGVRDALCVEGNADSRPWTQAYRRAGTPRASVVGRVNSGSPRYAGRLPRSVPRA